MDNQHKMITGYRDLSLDEINTMNAIKAKGEELQVLIGLVGSLANVDQRWVAIAKTHFQEGLMALTRSVAQPTSF